MNNPKDIVKEGYDLVSFVYRADDPNIDSENYLEYKAWTKKVSDLLEPGASILDLGCGCGVPATQLLARDFKVTGCDHHDAEQRATRSQHAYSGHQYIHPA